MVLIKTRAIRRGARLLPGGFRLLIFRWLLMIAVSLPWLIVAQGAVSDGIARSPYYTSVQGRLPVVHLLRLFGELPPTLILLLSIVVVVGLFFSQLLNAGALAFFDQGGRSEVNPAVWRRLLHGGLPFFWVFARILLSAFFFVLLGFWALGWAFDTLLLKGEPAGWSGLTLSLHLPLLKGLGCMCWLWLVGSWAHAAKVITVLDNRRRLRRTFFLALRFCWRHFFRLVIFFALVTFLASVSGAALLFFWRQSVPRSGAAFSLLLGGAVALSFFRSFLWYWLHHAAAILYRDGQKTGDLREASDEAWGWFASLVRRVGAMRRRAVKSTDAV